MLRTIVTPIDGSKHAQLALDLATNLAARYEARLVLINAAVGDEDVPEERYNAASRELSDAEADGLDTGVPPHRSHYLRVIGFLGKSLLESAKQQAEDKGVKEVETVIALGGAGEQILHHVERTSADLIVMGSRGFSELKGLVLGSVSQKVLEYAPCPCLTVHRKGEESGALEVKRILVATDGSVAADRAVALASDVASRLGAELVLQYVMWRGPLLEQLRATVDTSALSQTARDELDPKKNPIAERAGSAFFPPVVSKETLIEIGEQVLDRGRNIAEAKNVGKTELILLDGDPARKIVQTAKHGEIDLVVLGSRGLGTGESLLHGSVSYKVSHSAPCSCMVVR
ncbi:universal stress protein [Roseovarius sp. 2305UL8-3]|uniref:universal stress protein n=1 Tax=Roseovarius conchicola TaxID=3121636 RepID=UPI003526D76C